MAKGATVKIVGLPDAQAAIRAIPEEYRGPTLARIGKAAMLPVQNDAKQRAPFKTGNLRRSIHTETTEQRAFYAETSTGSDVVYAWFQEKRRSYLRSSLDDNRGAIQREAERAAVALLRNLPRA